MTTERQKVEALIGLTVDEVDRAWKFYENKIYDDSYKAQLGLFTDTKEIFNPVPKIAFIMNALTVRKNLEIEVVGDKETESKDMANESMAEDRIWHLWDYNKFQKMKYLIILWLILTKKAYVELIPKRDPVTGERVIVFNLLDRSNIEEIKKIENQIVYARLKGEVEEFNPETREFETIGVTKEYYNINGFNTLVETISDTKKGKKEERVIPLTWGFVPIVEFDTDYDIFPLFNKIDAYNQIEAYLDNIFYLHGDPLMWTDADEQLGEEETEAVSKSRYKQQALLYLGPERKLAYLEMQGNIAKLMLEKQDKLLEIIQNDYPEYVLAALLSKGDPSGDALEVKATEIIAKVESLRGDFEVGVTQMNNMALQMLGHSPVDHHLLFEDILPKSLHELAALLIDLRGIRMLSRKSLMKKLPKIYPDPEEELKELDAEEREYLESLSREFGEHDGDLDADTQD